MIINKGDIVILTEADQVKLQPFVGQRWQVEAVINNAFPESAVISRNGLQATCYTKNLEVVPPPDSPLAHGDNVKISKAYAKVNHRTCDKTLIGKVGKIKSFDSRINYYYVKCQNGETGWFPISSLIPIDFKGEHFFYPTQQVKYKNKIVIVSQTRKSKFNFGQLLLIDGNWIPSTDVEVIPT